MKKNVECPVKFSIGLESSICERVHQDHIDLRENSQVFFTLQDVVFLRGDPPHFLEKNSSLSLLLVCIILTSLWRYYVLFLYLQNLNVSADFKKTGGIQEIAFLQISPSDKIPSVYCSEKRLKICMGVGI